MAITEIKYGSIASSKELNDNFNVLNKDIQDLATSLNTTNANIAMSMSTLNKNVANQISEVNESLANTKSELEEKVKTLDEGISDLNAKNDAPDYSKTTVINLGSGSAVGFNGWMSVRAYTNPNDQYFFVYINGTPVFTIRGGSSSGFPDDSTSKFMVSTNDIITYEGNATHTFYRIPFKGGN